MNINLGIVPLASGEVQSVQEFSDGTVRLTFLLKSGKTATLIMSKEEAEHIYNELAVVLHGGL